MQRKAELALIMATFFWGWTFPVIKDIIVVFPVFAFLMWRFGIAALLMMPGKTRPNFNTLKKGTILGLLLFFAFAFQTVGLIYTSPENCAFITALSLLVIAIFRARTLKIWGAISIAVVGFWFLTTPNQGLNIGDLLTLVSAFLYAMHILVLDKLNTDDDSKQLAMLQFAIIAVLCFISSLLFEDSLMPDQWSFSVISALAICILGATIYALWAQTHFQRYTTAIRTSLIFSLEPVFAVIMTYLFYESDLSISTGIGGGLIFVALILVRRSNPMH